MNTAVANAEKTRIKRFLLRLENETPHSLPEAWVQNVTLLTLLYS